MPKLPSNPGQRICLAIVASSLTLALLGGLSACTVKRDEGSKENPVQVSMVPSKDSRALLLSGEDFAKWMEKETGYEFEVSVPTSYVAVVEAIGSKRVDIAFLNTTTYFMAHDKYGAEAQFITLGADGSSQYKGQFLVRSDSKIKKLEDIHGRKIAYVDPTSASGYILPAYQLKSKKNSAFGGCFRWQARFSGDDGLPKAGRCRCHFLHGSRKRAADGCQTLDRDPVSGCLGENQNSRFHHATRE